METQVQTKKVDYTQQISFGEKFGYGLGDLASNLVFAAMGTFMTFFYTDVAGMGAGVIGTIMLISRLLDGISDIGMGIIMDRTKSKYGKARPWILWMAVPFGICAALLFTVPNFGPAGKIIYVFITYNLMSTVIYTAINIPYGAMNSLMTQDQFQRSVINIFRMVMAMAGALTVNMITLPVAKAFGDGPKGWSLTFATFGAVATILFIITFLTTKERVKPAAGQEQKTVPVKEGFKALMMNKYWMIMVILGVVTFIGQGIGGANIYYAQYVLGDKNYIGTLTMTMMVPMIVGMFLVALLIKRIGKRNSALIGTVIVLIGQVIMMISPSNLTFILVASAIKGLGSAPLVVSVFAMVADTIEYGEWKSGVRTEGLVYSAASFGGKVGAGLGVALIGWVLSTGGYVGGVSTQSAAAIGSIKILFLYIPAIITVLQFVLLWFYKLDKEYPKIVEELHQRSLAK
ncbi:MFS transporter [Clostridium sp. CF012]|uniref:MFS transporter n=1 Tax=Clostridium sp. CF012 TaxID=2843319 RepID=UPI001C0D076C|nr:MFS transporter [Clostridium sp. CF012]MBU3146866.1 MFS transporter [Clostridium sp. CF012]